ncbi:DNA polymerase III subunit delta [Collinsella tanakaei]|uniref:DNA polymerase III subunit delta n=1 Tax=Collinsella tanakaei TaxID=626935 RepID=UPI001F3CEE5E|nr:DNA polymerase III subunit delta [Collinsella tanakaei]MCF2620897.1 DNA polymerase III subunit delta [Collinsella tanakaei]MDM8301191.1 DNA polymerase III subunit delta [Collinsella tanakaei]
MADPKLLPAYLIVGADEYKRSHAVERMKSRLEASGMAAFNLDERDMTKDQAIDDIIASLNTYPMGTDFRLVILEGCDRLPKAVSEPLVDYLADPSPTTVCLLVAASLAKNTRLYKAVAKIDAKAIVDCTPKKAWEMPKQVVGMARAHGKTIGLAAAEELVSRAGESSRMLDNELARLASMIEGPEITVADVERLVMRTAEVKPWDLLNAVSARDLPRALELLALQPDRSEVRLFSLLVGRIRELIVAKALDARGAGRELADALGCKSWQVKNHLGWARRYRMDELVEALSAAADVEAALKGSRDSALALRMWIISVCSK